MTDAAAGTIIVGGTRTTVTVETHMIVVEKTHMNVVARLTSGAVGEEITTTPMIVVEAIRMIVTVTIAQEVTGSTAIIVIHHRYRVNQEEEKEEMADTMRLTVRLQPDHLMIRKMTSFTEALVAVISTILSVIILILADGGLSWIMTDATLDQDTMIGGVAVGIMRGVAHFLFVVFKTGIVLGVSILQVMDTGHLASGIRRNGNALYQAIQD